MGFKRVNAVEPPTTNPKPETPNLDSFVRVMNEEPLTPNPKPPNRVFVHLGGDANAASTPPRHSRQSAPPAGSTPPRPPRRSQTQQPLRSARTPPDPAAWPATSAGRSP